MNLSSESKTYKVKYHVEWNGQDNVILHFEKKMEHLLCHFPEGIAEVDERNPYCYEFTKARMFSWKELQPRLIAWINDKCKVELIPANPPSD